MAEVRGAREHRCGIIATLNERRKGEIPTRSSVGPAPSRHETRFGGPNQNWVPGRPSSYQKWRHRCACSLRGIPQLAACTFDDRLAPAPSGFDKPSTNGDLRRPTLFLRPTGGRGNVVSRASDAAALPRALPTRRSFLEPTLSRQHRPLRPPPLRAFAIGADGKLTAAPGTPMAIPDVDGGPKPLAVDSPSIRRRQLRAARAGRGLTYDGTTGAVTLVTQASVTGAGPCWVRTSPNGSTLHRVNTGDDSVSVLDATNPMAPVETRHLALVLRSSREGEPQVCASVVDDCPRRSDLRRGPRDARDP